MYYVLKSLPISIHFVVINGGVSHAFLKLTQFFSSFFETAFLVPVKLVPVTFQVSQTFASLVLVLRTRMFCHLRTHQFLAGYQYHFFYG